MLADCAANRPGEQPAMVLETGISVGWSARSLLDGGPSLRIVLRVAAVDDYLRGLDSSTRAAFEHIQGLVMDVVPDAEQGTSYGMAAFRYRRKPLLGLLAATQHLSIFPFSPQIVDAVRDRLTAFELSKGTIRFTIAKPLPDEVVREIVRLRVEEIDGTAR